MSEAVAKILDEVEQLSAVERQELADELVQKLVGNVPQAVHDAQLAEVRRRIAEVENGKVTLVPGEEALERVRQIVRSARK